MNKIATRLLVVLTLIFSTANFLSAQGFSSLTGVVTDSTGAVVPGVAVVLVDAKTNTQYQTVTTSSGSYTIPSVKPAESYKVTFTRDGFQSFAVTDLAIGVGATRTQNALLVAGTAMTVEVSAGSASASINTVDASIGNNLDIKLLADLPVLARNSPSALFSLQPGITGTSVTGARTDQSAVTLDGLDVNDIAAGGSFNTIAGRAPVDTIQEFRGTVAGKLSSNGPGGGGQFQLVTKGGTNDFHGGVSEYHRDNALTANSWFNNNNKIRKPGYIQNQFGGNLGGPILKDKAFFFFNFLQSRIVQSSSITQTVPLDSYRAGTINYINKTIDPSTGAACGAASRLNTTPSCISNLSAAGIKALDPQGVGFNPALLALINSRYPRANDLTGGNGINTGAYRFTAPTPTLETDYTAKIEYNLTKTQRVFVRGSITRQDATQSAIQFPGDPVTHPFQDRTYSYVFGHNWTIGSNKVNALYIGNQVEKYNFPTTYQPTGINQLSLGGLTSPYAGYSSQRRRVPIPVIRDDFNWTKGSHNILAGGSFKFIKTNSALVSDFNTDSIGVGGNTNSLNASLRPADIRSAGTTSASVYDSAFTTALGRVAAVSSSYNYNAAGNVLPQGTGAVRHYRFFQTELYLGDTWKVSKNLTLNYGVRYQLYTVPYETTGSQSSQSLSFDQYFASRVAQSGAGKSGDNTVPFLTYNLSGKANNAAPLYKPSYKDFAPSVAFAYTPSSSKGLVINGSAGVVFDRTVINAVNFIQDQSSYLFQQVGISKNYGTSGNANASLLNDPRLGANLSVPAPPTSPAITKPYIPGVSNGVPVGLSNNLFQTVVDPTLKDPYNIVYNVGIQQELPAHFIMKLSYAGRLGRRLLAQADASQLIEFPDTASGQLLSNAFAYLTNQARASVPVGTPKNPKTVTPQPWFENQAGAGATQFFYDNFNSYAGLGDFADFVQGLAAGGYVNSNIGLASQFGGNTFITNKGFSSYNGLLFTLQKNLSQGLRFDFNYTWSHSIDNTSQVANSIASNTGYGFVCDVLRPRNCRGNSDFDITHVINADFTYQLPYGRGRHFGSNAPFILEELLGGWNFSGLPSYRSGQTYTTATGAYVAGYANNAPAIFNGDIGGVAAHAHKTSSGSVNIFNNQTVAAGDFVGPVGFTVGSRNSLRGPKGVFFDASLAKRFRITPERVSLTLKGDAFNVLNHPVFSVPTYANSDINASTFGNITTTASGARVVQVSGAINF